MKRLLLVLVAAALLLPAAARSAACSPLNCAPSQFSLSHGTLLAYRHSALGPVRVADLRTGKRLHTVPGGFVGGNLLVHRHGLRLEWYDLRTGALRWHVAAARGLRLAGVSQNGTRAVGFRILPGARAVVIVSPHGTRSVLLPAASWDFDALRGNNLFLIRYLAGGGYQVVTLDLARSTPVPRLLKDPHESGTIWGSPFARLASPDGTLLFTLYLSSNGAAMVHQLDLVHPRARCIDLPGTGDYGSAASWAMALSPDGATLWAASPGYGRVVAIDVATRRARSVFTVALPSWNVGLGTRAALSADGRVLALADGHDVVTLALDDGRVLERTHARATGLGWAPGGRLRTLP